MKNKIYTVPQVPGSKRQSARPYTHAVIGVWDHAYELTWYTKINKTDIENYKYYTEKANRNAGDTVHVTGCITPWSYPEKQEAIDKAKKWLAENVHESGEAFAEAMRLKNIERIKAEQLKPETLVVLRWSMSASNAAKGLGEFQPRYKNLQVVECVEVVKK